MREARVSELACPKLRRFEAPLLHRWLKLPPEHAGLVDAAPEPPQLLAQLRDRQLWREAMRLLAYALPEREAVWWSAMCVAHTGSAMPDAEKAAVAAAEAWVRRPGPATRRDAGLAAAAVGFAAPGAFCAMGAVWSHRERFLPNLCGGRGAATAVDLAVKRGAAEPERVRKRYEAFLDSGLDIGNGGAGRLPAEAAAAARAA